MVIDLGIQCQHANHRQLVALAHRVIVLVMRGRDLDHAGAEGLVHVVVGNDRNAALAQGQGDVLADQVLVALVLRVHHHRHVAQHGFGPGGRDHQTCHQFAAHPLRTLGKRVADVPHEAVFLFVFHFQIAHRALQHRVPVHQTFATVDQALLVQLHKGFGHRFGQLGVHGEVLAAPVHAVAHAAHLRGDGVATLFFPLPHLAHKVFAAQVVAADFLLLQLALHHDLRGNAGVVGARNPDRVVATHAVVAGERVHDGLVKRMPHVQRARDVGRWQLDGEGLGAILRLARTTVAGMGVVAALPLRSPMGFQGGGLKRFGQAVEAGLLQFVVHGISGVFASGAQYRQKNAKAAH